MIGLFGCQKHRQEWEADEQAYRKYSEEVKQSLSEKVASVVEDATDAEDLKMINEHLIIKWDWLNKGIFDGCLPLRFRFSHKLLSEIWMP